MYKGLKMCNIVRWPSRGLVLRLFAEYLNKIKLFINDQHAAYQELSDDNWVSKLMFFAGLYEHLNDSKVKFQGSSKTLSVNFGYIMAFEKKLEISNRDEDGERF